MKDTNSMKVTIDVLGKIDSFTKNLNLIQGQLNRLHLSDNLKDSFSNLFTDLEKEISSIQNAVGNNQLNLIDEKKVSKSIAKIDNLYGTLIKKLNSSGVDTVFLEKDRTALNGILKAQQSYTKEIKTTLREQEKLNKKLEEAKEAKAKGGQEKNKTKVSSEKYSLMQSREKAAKSTKKNADKKVAEAQAKVDERIKNSGGKYTDVDSKGFKNTAEYQNLKKAIEEATQATNELKNAQADLAKHTTTEKIEQEAKDLAEALDKAEKELQNFNNTKGKEGNSKALESVKKQLQELKGINWSELGVDLNNIKSVEDLEQAYNKLSTAAGERAKQALGVIETASEQAGQEFGELKGKIDTATNSLDQMIDREKEIDNLKNKILQFFSIGNVVGLFQRAVTSALNTVKELDATMTEAAVVTDFSVGDMWSQLPKYSEEATKLGAKINDLYAATTLYYQQGLNTNAAMGAGVETMKMARIAGMDASKATEAMTAALRGFNMEVNEINARNVNDVYSSLAAKSAANTQQIATAMEKTASIAASANMDFKTTAALLAQIIETTQEAPETAGTAMKTIIARFSEVKSLANKGLVSGEDEEGEIIDVNKIQTALRTVGISMDEYFEGKEGLTDIFLKLSEKWKTLDFETQRYIATMAAGSRQQSRFIAMMSNYGRTTELVSIANNSAGASQEQFNKTLDSLEAKINKLKNAWDQFLMGLTNNEVIKFFIDLLTTVITTINSVTTAISGGNGLIKTFASLALVIGGFKLGNSLFNKQGGFFNNILGKAGYVKKEAGKAGQESGNSFKLNFINSCRTLKEDLKKVKLKDKIKEVFNFTKQKEIPTKDLIGIDFQKVNQILTSEQKDILKNNEKFKKAFSNNLTTLKDQMGKQLLNTDQIENINNIFKTEGMDAASEKLKEYGVSLEFTEEMGEFAGETLQITENNINKIGGAAAVAGGLLMSFAGFLENIGAAGWVIDIVKGIATALMIIPVALQVVDIAMKVFSKSVSASIMSIPVIGWIIGIITALGALIGLIVGMSKAAYANSIEGQLENARKATEAAKQAAEEAKRAYEELLSDKNEYNDLQKTLNELTKGTEEWQQALIKANDQVFELITKYPELAQYLKMGKSGGLEIDEQGFQKVINESRKASNRATANVLTNQMIVNQLEQKQQEETIKKKFSYVVYDPVSDSMETYYEVNTRQIIEEYLSSSPDQLLQKDENGNYSEALQELDEQSQYTAEELYNLAIELQQLNNTVENTRKQEEANARASLMATVDQETLAYEYSEGIINTAAKGFSSEVVEKEIKEQKNNLYVGSQDEDDREKLMDQYGVSREIKGEKERLQALYKKMAGVEEVPEEIKNNVEALAAEVAKMHVQNTKATNIDIFREKMQKADSTTQKKLNSFLTGNFDEYSFGEAQSITSNSRSDQLSQIAKDLKYEGVGGLAAGLGVNDKTIGEMTSPEQNKVLEWYAIYGWLKDSKGKQITYDDLQNMTIEEKANLKTLYQNENIGANWVLELQVSVSADEAQAEIEGLQDKFNARGLDLTKGLKENNIGVIKNLYNQTSIMSIKDAQAYLENFEKITKGNVELQQRLSSVNWGNFTEAKEALKYMQDMNVDKNAARDYWLQATEAANAYITSVNEALSIVTSAQNDIKKLNEIFERLAEGTATSEDLQFLAGLDVDLSGTEMTAEGWRLVGEAINNAKKEAYDFYNYTGNVASDITEDRLNEYEDMIKFRRNKKSENHSSEGAFGLTNSRTQLGWWIEQDEKTGKYKLTDNWLDEKDDLSIFQLAAIDEQLNLGFDLSTEEGKKAAKEKVKKVIPEILNSLNNKEFILGAAKQSEAFLHAQGKSNIELRIEGIKGAGDEENYFRAQNIAAETRIVEADYKIEDLQNYSKVVAENFSGSLKRTLEAEALEAYANEIAADIMILNSAIQELTDNWEEWNLILDKGINDEAFQKSYTYIQALLKIKKIIKNMFGTDLEVSDGFFQVQENLDLIEEAAAGDVEAIGKLRGQVAKDIILNVENGGQKTLDGVQDTINKIIGKNYEIGMNVKLDLDIQNLLRSLLASGLSYENIQNIFKGLGLTISLEVMDIEDNGVEYVHASQLISMDPQMAAYSGYYKDANGKIYKVNNIISSGDESFTVDPNLTNKEEDTKNWKNPFDKYFNKVEALNELLRKRNLLEKEYERILAKQNTTPGELEKYRTDLLKNLEEEIKRRKELAGYRLQEIKDAKKATYEVKNGVIKSYQRAFKDAGGGSLDQYGIYNEKTGQVEIDHAALDKLQKQNAELGTIAEAYINYLKDKEGEYEDELEGVQDGIDQINDTIREATEQRSEYVNTVAEAMQKRDQTLIDNAQALSDILSTTNQKILDSLQESIDLERQIRDNTKKEEEIADMEARLAYLRRDTSGANAQEIRELEKQLKDTTEEYGDTLIDQEIDRLSKDNEKAQEQRQKQIDLAQAQLDFWVKTGAYMMTAQNSNLSFEDFMQYWEDLNDYDSLNEYDKLIKNEEAARIFNSGSKDSSSLLSYDMQQNSYQDSSGRYFKKDLNSDKIRQVDKEGNFLENGAQYNISDIVSGDFNAKTINFREDLGSALGILQQLDAVINSKSSVDDIKKLQEGLNTLIKDGKLGRINTLLTVDGRYNQATRNAVKVLQNKLGSLNADGIWGPKTHKALINNDEFKAYKTGGLADFTGPAWLDGTKSHPELVLNQRDTQNFIQLKDILAEILTGATSARNTSQLTKGDTYYDITIQVDSISSDYDVDQMAARIKQQIYEDSSYRNVNSISLMR